MQRYIVTVTASDAIGIIHAVTQTIADQQGNVVELSQTVLQGYFTIILSVEFATPPDPLRLRDLISRQGKEFQLAVVVLPQEPSAVEPVPGGERFILTLLGSDTPGNIATISGALAARGVNILDLYVRVDRGRFSIMMEALLPPDLTPSKVRAELEELGAELGLEAFVQHANIFTATSEPRPVRIGPPSNPEGPETVVPH